MFADVGSRLIPCLNLLLYAPNLTKKKLTGDRRMIKDKKKYKKMQEKAKKLKKRMDIDRSSIQDYRNIEGV